MMTFTLFIRSSITNSFGCLLFCSCRIPHLLNICWFTIFHFKIGSSRTTFSDVLPEEPILINKVARKKLKNTHVFFIKENQKLDSHVAEPFEEVNEGWYHYHYGKYDMHKGVIVGHQRCVLVFVDVE